MSSVSADYSVGLHFQLSCYVRVGGPTKVWSRNDWLTFTHIFQRRPDGYRYAVARQLLLLNEGVGIASKLVHRPAPDWLCWDLYHDSLSKVPSRGLFAPPVPVWQGPSEAALVMKAIHHG